MHLNSENIQKNSYWIQKNSWGSSTANCFYKLQKRYNSSVIPIFTQFVIIQLCHFTNQAQGDRRMVFHPEIDTK